MIQYDEEQEELEKEITELEARMEILKPEPVQLQRFIDIIRKYKYPEELTAEMVNELIDKIIVHDFSGAGSSRTQKVEIHFSFVGEINLAYTEDELKAIQAEKEAKELAKKEAQKERGKEYRARKKAERYAANEGHKFAKRICEQCGKEYWPTRPSQKYCSKECGRAHEAFVRMNRNPAEKEGHKFFKRQCVVCGKEFWPSGPNSICCCDECRKQRISIRKKANYDAVKRAAV